MEEWDSYIQMVEESEKPRDPFVIPEEPSPIPSPPIPSPSPSPPPLPKPVSPPQKLPTPSPSPSPPPPPKLPTPLPTPSPSPPQILSPPKIPTPPPAKSPTPPPLPSPPKLPTPSPPPKTPSPIPQPSPSPPAPILSPSPPSPPPTPPRAPSPLIPIHSILPTKELPTIPFIPILPSPIISFEPQQPQLETQQVIPEVAVELDIEPMYVESISVPMPMSSMADLLEVMIPEENEEDIISPIFAESSSGSDTLSPMFDIDLGAFELVDSGVTAEALLSHDDPVIYHKDMPVHSVHHDTVQTEAALENLMNAPSSMLSESVPPAMVCDNYCFVVDGDKVRMGDIMGDDQWWRHTSRPTKYFYSDDMKKFYRVNVISAKGKIITARLAAGASTSPNSSTTVPHSQSHQHPPSTSSMVSTALGMPSTSRSASLLSTHAAAASYPGTTIHSVATTPRASMCVGSTKGHRGEIVPLSNVYKVIRVYSFWKTCTSFHRIVTMIDTVTPDDKNANTEFNKRLFVQYLWRNAKPYEKARVQKEFDPRRQRLLRFVGDTEQKKKAMKPSTSAATTTSSSSASAWRRLAGGGSAPPTSSGRPTSRGSVASEGRPRQPQKTSRTSSTSSSRGKNSDDFTNAESIIEFPIAVNTAITDIEHEFNAPDNEIIQYHIGKDDTPIPVFCADSKPFDVKRALVNAVKCPIRFLSKAPPTLVTENYCFVVDGDIVDFETISKDSSIWWKDTGTATRYYSTDCFRTFYQVTMLMARGQLRSAYRHKQQRGAGMEQVPLNKVFRVSRFFSYWKSCRSFHRIISLVSPVTEDGEKEYGFKKRIFIQYLWRTDQKADKDRVALEFASSTSSPGGTRRRRGQLLQMPRNSIDILPPIPTFIGSVTSTSSERSFDQSSDL